MERHQFLFLAFATLVSQVTGDHGCYSGWIRLGLKCHNLVTANYNFDQAAAYCKRNGYAFGSVQDEMTKDGLRHYAVERSVQFWVGLRNINGTWKWNDGTSYVMDKTDWVEGEPSDYVGHDCVYVSRCTSGKYKTTTCTSTRYFLAEKHGRHGGWGPWSAWGKCSKSCGTGRQKRTRSCNTPSQISPGDPCFGFNDDYRPCNTHHCTTSWGLCYVFGDPHYYTFDKKRYPFQGADMNGRECKFLLAARCKNSPLPPFQILGTNKYCGRSRSVSCPRTVELHFRGHVIKMDHYIRSGKIWVDGLRVTATNYRGIRGLTVSRVISYTFRLSINNGAVFVEYNGANAVKIGVDSCSRGSSNGLCGLCGNYDGNSNNDLYLPDGSTNSDPKKFAWSYHVPGRNGLSCQMDPTSLPCKNYQCSKKSACTALTRRDVFGTCVQHQQFYPECAYDMCCSAPQPDQCDIFWDFVQKCINIGYPAPSMWLAKTNCKPPPCPTNSSFVAGASACQDTCTGQADGCKDIYVPGTCVCRSGHVWEGDTCVPRNLCGCVDGNGEVHPIGASWLDKCCQTKYICGLFNGMQRAVIRKTDFQCHKYARCVIIDGSYGCQCFPGHNGTESVCDEFTCPDNQTALYMDPESCNHYYLCYRGDASHHKCSSVLRYNNTLQGCMFNTECFDDCSRKHKPHKLSVSKRSLSDFECPKENGVFPVAGSSTKFYACAEGIPTEGQCHSAYRFDESRGKCVPDHEKMCVES